MKSTVSVTCIQPAMLQDLFTNMFAVDGEWIVIFRFS